MEGRAKELYDKLTALETKMLAGGFDTNLEMQSHKTDISSLKDIVDELKIHEARSEESRKSDFDSVGAEISLTSTRLAELTRQLDALEERTTILEEHKKKTDNRVWSYVDKAVIAIISGIMTMLFSNL